MSVAMYIQFFFCDMSKYVNAGEFQVRHLLEIASFSTFFGKNEYKIIFQF